MKFKGVYLHNVTQSNESGVSKKIKANIKAYEKLGVEIYELAFSQNKSRYFSRLIHTKIYEFDYIDFNDYNFIHIRKPIIDRSFLDYFKKIKTYNIKIFLEIPTYPYLMESFSHIKKFRII